MLFGRERELARLEGLLERARAGHAGAVVVRGEAGVGKSALLDAVVAAGPAAGMRVLRGQGLESESPLAFAGLHQLLRPLAGRVGQLPAPQARALRVAFGEQEGPAVDPFLVALATLGLLTDAAESQPVLAVVDDAHWLDDASTAALLFAARRLQADPVALVFGAREGDDRTFTADGLDDLALTGLDEASSRALLAARVGGSLSEEVVASLLAQTGGNALALVELPTELTAAQLAGTASLPGQLHLTDRVQRVFLQRCRRLSQEVQTLLLVAAADDTGSLAVVGRAAAALGVGEGAVELAEEAQLLTTDRDRFRVGHPLVRSAMYQAATGHERRAAHRALAAALAPGGAAASTGGTVSADGLMPDGSGESGLADRRAWHLAAATEGPDPLVAAGLERVGVRAERAGAAAAAAAAFERAAELTTDEQEDARRTFAAARCAWAAGQSAHAAVLADRAKALADDRLLRADIDRLRARIEVNVGSAATAHHIFISAARAVSADDPVRALEMLVAATLTHQYNAAVPHDLDEVIATDEVMATDEATPGPVKAEGWLSGQSLPDDPRTRCLRDLLAATAADTAHQWADALPLLSRAVDATAAVEDPDVLANVGNAALHLGDDVGHRRCFTRMLAGARDRGALMSVLYALPRLAYADLLSGDWNRVRDAAQEAISLAGAAGQRSLTATPLAWLTLLAALRGDDRYEGLRAELDEAQRQPLGVLTDPVHDMSRWAAGVHATHAGDTATALHHFAQMRVTTIARMASLDRFDAAIRAENEQLAQDWADDLAGFADATGWGWALAAVAHGRALLADPADAPALFETALAHHAHSHRPYELARTHLAYGELLRRSQRRVDSRTHLRAAGVLFDELGAAPLADRAAQELRASGETARKRDPSTLTSLTPMEMQVVELVAQGMSNKDVAAQLWISPRTVAFHLRGAFAKLGVSSRGALSQLDLPLQNGGPARASRAAPLDT